MRDNNDTSSLFLLFKRAHHALSTHAARVVGSATGTPAAQVAALVLLEQRDGILIRELGERLGLESPGTTGLLARLEREGLARRTPEKTDRRAARIHITPKGRRIVVKAVPILAEISDRMTEGLNPAQVATITQFLERMLVTDEREAVE